MEFIMNIHYDCDDVKGRVYVKVKKFLMYLSMR